MLNDKHDLRIYMDVRVTLSGDLKVVISLVDGVGSTKSFGGEKQ